MHNHNVESSFISSIAYNSKTRELYLLFKSGKAYAYKKVGAKVFTAFMNAESKGKFYNQSIINKYESEEIETAA